MHLSATAIVCAVLAHGEHGAVARLMTPEDGLLPGYVRGGRSRRLKPVLLPGNIVQAEFRARSEDQLAQLTVELVHSRAGLLGEPLAAAAIEWATALTAATLPEGQPFPTLHVALDGLIAAIEAAPSARGWGSALVLYELLLLGEIGFGLDLSACAVTDARDDLIYVSPKSGRAVSRVAGQDYRDRLLHLPPFMATGGPARDWADIHDGLKLTGHFLGRDVLIDRRAPLLAARERLIDRIKRLS
ncbi:DNA replication and repair protein RecO [Sphingomonas laterariae]|uniref:DNA repair protein RecO n=1 Tax=Edaphosphingomonas laterariae TaxID=861865 RepID=A0A239G7T8_9SPHN|nr:DNA repair protein RecO [Sphingomonas laterariae]SNS65035.1 DNA replication and repair protein RecO [Sphingomonas laterariae]